MKQLGSLAYHVPTFQSLVWEVMTAAHAEHTPAWIYWQWVIIGLAMAGWKIWSYYPALITRLHALEGVMSPRENPFTLHKKLIIPALNMSYLPTLRQPHTEFHKWSTFYLQKEYSWWFCLLKKWVLSSSCTGTIKSCMFGHLSMWIIKKKQTPP